MFSIWFFRVSSMGSVPENTPCAYCGVPRGGYIPDGAAGPMCAECLDVLCDYLERPDERPERWRAVQRFRLERFLDTFTVLSVDNELVRLELFLQLTIAEFIVYI